MRSVADWKSLVCCGLLLAFAVACDSGDSSEAFGPTDGSDGSNTSNTSGGSGDPPAPPVGTVKPGDGETPVEAFGQLRVEGTQIVSASGDPVQLKGPSSMWLNWEQDGYAESLDALIWMRDNWDLTVIRAAMGVEPAGAYLSSGDVAMAQVTTIIENAIDAGVYVIVDWHDHNAHMHQAESEAFFSEIAATYGDLPNIIYEPFNEPEQITWASDVKPYHEAVLAKIREKDPDNLVVLGTPNWSQYVDQAAASPVAGTNLLYTLHFYSCTHTASLRSRAEQALGKGLPLFVTEWGSTHADGGLDGEVCLDEARLWTDWMRMRGISWTAWKLDNCTDSSCYFAPTGAPRDGAWTDAMLQDHGLFVRDRMLE